MIFGQTPTNINQEPKKIKTLGSDGNDIWADTNNIDQYPKVSFQDQRSQSVKQRFWMKLSWGGQHGPQTLPEPLETMDYISLQEQEETPS